MRRRKNDPQRLLFPIHEPRPRPLPKITEAQAAALIRQGWRLADGTPIPEDLAERWAFLFHRHLKYEPTPIWLPPRPRKRPERPTAKRLNVFLAIETDWLRVTPHATPVAPRRDDECV